MASELAGKTIAILITDGFEQAALARTEIVSPGKGEVRGWKDKDWGDSFPVDVALETAGGDMNLDPLRMNRKAVDFVKSFFDAGKPLAAICHGPWTLAEAGVLHRPLLQTGIRNAGGNWVDREVVNDNGLATSRHGKKVL